MGMTSSLAGSKPASEVFTQETKTTKIAVSWHVTHWAMQESPQIQ